MIKHEDFYEKLIEKILKTNFKKEEKIELLGGIKETLEKVNCIDSFSPCPYCVEIDRTSLYLSAKCSYSKEIVGFSSDSDIDKKYYVECPYEKLYRKCENSIERLYK